MKMLEELKSAYYILCDHAFEKSIETNNVNVFNVLSKVIEFENATFTLVNNLFDLAFRARAYEYHEIVAEHQALTFFFFF